MNKQFKRMQQLAGLIVENANPIDVSDLSSLAHRNYEPEEGDLVYHEDTNLKGEIISVTTDFSEHRYYVITVKFENGEELDFSEINFWKLFLIKKVE